DMENIDKIFEFLLYMPDAVPYIAAFSLLLACGVGLPLPEDITLFVMGFLAYNGVVNFKISLVVCLFGVLIGDCMIFTIGHRYGLRLASKGIFAKILH